MRKLFFVFLVLPLLLFVSCPDKDDSPENELNTNLEPPIEKSAFDYFIDNNIRAGINVGNSLDSHRNGVSNETAWGNPRINQKLLNEIKGAGFDIVRIPVTWMGQIGPAPDYKIKDAWMERVAEVAGYAQTAGLKVIINLHHDGSTDSRTSEAGWLSINKALANPAQKQEITAKFTKVWEQIALRFRDKGAWLFFEAFNELHDGGWFWPARVNQIPKEQYDLINEWAQVFTDTVRAAGGNNVNRYLVIPGYCTGPEALFTDKFILPTDSVADRLVVSFHYYRPDDFALDGEKTAWDTSAKRADITNNFQKSKQYFIDNHIPVIIGETGPVRNNSADGDAARLAYINFMYGEAKKYGLVPVYWDNGAAKRGVDGFGVFNRNNGSPVDAERAAVIQAMINAVK